MASPPPEAHRIFREYLEAVGLHGQASAAAAGLAPTEWYALSALNRAGRLTSGELAEVTGLTTGAATRLIDRLERGGHARRVAEPTDRRRVVIEPTDPALPVDEIVGPARRRIADLLASYTAEQLNILYDYFTRAAPAFREATEEIRHHTARDRRGAGTQSPAS